MKIYCLPITSRFFLRLVNVLSENKPVKPSCLLRNSLRKLVAKFQSRKIAFVPLWPKHFQTTWIVAMGHKQGIGVQDCQVLTVWGLWEEPVKDHKISECLLSTCPYLSSLWSHYCHPVHWSSTLVSPLWQDRTCHLQSQKDLTMQHLMKRLGGEAQGCEMWAISSGESTCKCRVSVLVLLWMGEMCRSSLIRYLCHMADGKRKSRLMRDSGSGLFWLGCDQQEKWGAGSCLGNGP